MTDTSLILDTDDDSDDPFIDNQGLCSDLDGNATSPAHRISDDDARAFFDWLRQKQPNKRLSQQAVDGTNTLLTLMGIDETKRVLSLINGWSDTPHASASAPTSAQTKADIKKTMILSDKAMAMIARFEGFRSSPYLDSAGVPTIGYGTTYYPDGKKVSMTDKPIDQKTALFIKKQIIDDDFAFAVNALFADEITQNKLTQNQFDALVSLAYNIGAGALKKSSVYRHIKAGKKQAAADAFLAWNKARVGGRLTALTGLTKRRAAERELFLA